MDAVGQYILRLVCGASVCGLLLALTGSDGPAGKLRTMLCGLFLGYLAISPLANLELGELRYLDPGIIAQAEALARSGEAEAKEAMSQLIKEQCGAYILTKADEMGLSLQAEVSQEPETGLPVSVRITGPATPYEKEALISYITRTLGIERSGIQW